MTKKANNEKVSQSNDDEKPMFMEVEDIFTAIVSKVGTFGSLNICYGHTSMLNWKNITTKPLKTSNWGLIGIRSTNLKCSQASNKVPFSHDQCPGIQFHQQHPAWIRKKRLFNNCKIKERVVLFAIQKQLYTVP